MGLLQKIRLAALSDANSAVDKVIDMNSVGAVKQEVRDLEGHIDELRDAQATAEGYVRTVTRERDALQAQATQLQHNIDFLLTDDDPSNDVSATALQVRLDTTNQQLAEKNDDIKNSTETAGKLSQALVAVEAKHQQMVAQVNKLESLDRAAKAQAGAAKTMEMAGQLMSESADVSVDDVAARIQRSADVASVKFDHAFEGMQDTTSKDVAFSEASAKIAQRKAELAALASQHAAAGTAESTPAAPATA